MSKYPDRIVCLECGRRYVFLPSHIARAHGMRAEEYRERHGLNRTAPLACESYRDATADRMRESGVGPRFAHKLRRDAQRPSGYTRRPQTRESQRANDLALHRAGTEASRKMDRIGPRLEACAPWPATTAQVIERTGCTRCAADTFLAMCVRAGRLVRIKRGLYDLPTKDTQ